MARTILSCLGLCLATAAAAGVTAGVSGVSPEAVAAAATLGGVAGNFATDLCRVLYRPVAERWLDGRSGIDENHHVACALRLAQLKALGTVRERLDTPWFGQGDPEQRQAAEAFSLALERFLDDETGSAERPGFQAGGLAADERVVRDAVLLGLPDMLDASLAARRAGGDNAAIRESLADVRAAAERAVLAEIGLRTGTRDLPAAFVRAFDGSDFPDSWFDLFVRDAAFRLKDDAGFERVWQAEQLSLVKAIAAANTAVLERIEAVQGEHTGMLLELLALARTGGVFQRAAAQGIPEAAVRAIVERLGGEGIAADDLIPWLDNWIDAARQELGRRTNEGEAFEAARREAERRFRAGRLREASAAFMDELERENRAEAERQAERKRHRIRLLEEAIRYDELAFDPPAVVAKLRMIADINDFTSPSARGDWFNKRAIGFYERGRDHGINAALGVAIAVFGLALEERTRNLAPLKWAAIQNSLGTALSTLGGRETGSARLEAAVIAYRAALTERTRDRVPLAWAMTQNDLGNALSTLGEREIGTSRLEEAVSAYRAALAESNREHAPLAWAMTQNNLGNTLQVLGRRNGSTRQINEAILAFRLALEERSPDRDIRAWAATQSNLGNALAVLGADETGTANLEAAASAYRLALVKGIRESVPLSWATTQTNLGNVLMMLGARESGTGRLEEALTAYSAALEERTRECAPLDWALTFGNQGVALIQLADRLNDEALAARALDQIETARDVMRDGGHATNAASYDSNLGLAIAVRARIRGG
nr:tetratricopeptide repeat protein [uncultured Rhodopila sp.]